MKTIAGILMISLVFFCTNIRAQKSDAEVSHTNYCVTDFLHQQKIKSDKNYLLNTESLNNQSALRTAGVSDPKTAAMTYTIPVVVHIVHNNGPENISDQQVIDGIRHLNDAFNFVAPYQGPNGVSIGIQFCLAKQDASGNFTTGINRVQSSLTNLDYSINDQPLKDLIRWDPRQYLNIWLVNEICSGTDCATAGYAYMAAAHGEIYDGVVNEARWFGSSKDNSKVHIHEVGHYLNLYHTFQGGCSNNNCMTDGDLVCDTPPDQSTAGVAPCSAFVNTCTTDDDDLSGNNPFRPVSAGGLGDQNDMVNNYMDYGYQVCQNAFTAGQKERMITALTGARNSLLNSNGCSTPCMTRIDAAFTPSSTNVIFGNSITFTDHSTGATFYSWKVNGTVFSSNPNPSYEFTINESATVTLIVSNGDPACMDSASVDIPVMCPAQASFDASAYSVLPGQSVNFTNTSAGAAGYEWRVNGTMFSNDKDPDYVFTGEGTYTIELRAKHATLACTDSYYKTIEVDDPCTPLKEGNIWYFGLQAGLDFNSGSPVALTDGQMATQEGCATISDQGGNLLFYTDGVTVWNKNHQIMENGTDMGGDASSTQSAVIVPQPGSANVYYIFTVDAILGTHHFYYSIADMTQNGGLGAVTVKKELIHSSSTERIAAVKHRNNTDVWILHHEMNNNRFGAYLLTTAGLQMVQVNSDVGLANTGGSSAIGALKASSDGKRIAMASTSPARAELFDFDNATGIISNPYFYPKMGILMGVFFLPYGVEFSPDCSKLYFSGPLGYLLQLDLNAADTAAITASGTYITKYTGTAKNFGAIQLGPDGRIYLANRDAQSLGVIKNPNLAGLACDFENDAIFLEGKLSQNGLPNFMANLYTPHVSVFGKDTVCTGQEVYKAMPLGGQPNSWTIAGDAAIVGSTDSTVTVKFNTAGNVMIKVRSGVCLDGPVDSLLVKVYSSPSVNLGKDTSLCSDKFPYAINAGTGFSSYLWQDGSIAASFTSITAGTYWVKVANSDGCVDHDTIKVGRNVTPAVYLADQTVCEGSIVNFDAGPGFTKYLWSDGSNLQLFSAFLGGKYWVSVTNSCGVASDTFNLLVKPLPVITFSGIDTVHCLKEAPVKLTGVPAGGVFSGEGIEGSMFNPQQAGIGVHDVVYNYTNVNGCAGSNTQRIKVLEGSVAILKDTLVCNSSFPLLLDPGSFAEYWWQDGSRGATYEANIPGLYFVKVVDGVGCVYYDTINIGIQLPFDIDMPDISICGGDSVLLNPGNMFDSYTWQDGSTSQTYTVFTTGQYYVTVTTGCESARDTVNVLIRTMGTPGQITGLDSLYCLSAGIISLDGIPAGGIFGGPGMSGNSFDVSRAGSGEHLLTYSYVDSEGCKNIVSKMVMITEDCLFIPNLITPNGDGENDYFTIPGLGTDYVLEVYNRWDKLIYKNDNYDHSFNGQQVSDGIYYYYLYSNSTNRKYKGWLQILR